MRHGTGYRTRLALAAWLATAALGAGCKLPEIPPSQGPDRSVAMGNRNNLYVVVPAGRGDDARFTYWQRDPAGAWHEPGVGQGEIAAAAAWGEHVLVFFPTGRYGLFGLETPLIEAAPASVWTPAAVAEDGPAVDAFGWTADEPTHARSEGGAWSVEKIDLPLKKEAVRDPCAARFRDRLFLAWREEVPALARPGSTWRLGFAYRDPEGWKGPYPQPGQPGLAMESAPQIAATEGLLLCLYKAPPGDGRPPAWALAAYTTSDENWHEITRLEGAPVEEPLALARWRDGFCVATIRDGRPNVAMLEGQPLGIGRFETLSSGERLGVPPGMGLSVLVLMMLLFVALVVVSQWRSRVMRDAGGPRGGPVAKQVHPLGRRIAAAAIDQVLVTVPLVAGVLHFLPDLPVQWFQGEPGPIEQVLGVQLARFGLTVLYFTLGEGLTGRTVGKALLGLEVRSVTGERIRLGQALIRNAARAIDEIPWSLYLVGLVSIRMGPMPQRLGDRLARTLVVRSPSAGASSV